MTLLRGQRFLPPSHRADDTDREAGRSDHSRADQRPRHAEDVGKEAQRDRVHRRAADDQHDPDAHDPAAIGFADRELDGGLQIDGAGGGAEAENADRGKCRGPVVDEAEDAGPDDTDRDVDT